MIGTDLPGSPTRWKLTRATRQPPEGIATALVANRASQWSLPDQRMRASANGFADRDDVDEGVEPGEV
jgi:hypothetical protein